MNHDKIQQWYGNRGYYVPEMPVIVKKSTFSLLPLQQWYGNQGYYVPEMPVIVKKVHFLYYLWVVIYYC